MTVNNWFVVEHKFAFSKNFAYLYWLDDFGPSIGHLLEMKLRDRHEIHFIFEIMVTTTESQRLSKYIKAKTLTWRVLSDGNSARLSLDLKLIFSRTQTVSQLLSSRE